MTPIESLIVSKTITSAYKIVENLFLQSAADLTSNEEDFSKAVEQHVLSIINWAEEIKFSDAASAKLTKQVYVPLDIYLYPRRIRMEEQEAIDVKSIDDILIENTDHLILTGQPGAGKTTSMKYACCNLIQNETSIPEQFCVPILIKFRDLSVGQPEGSRQQYADRDDVITNQLWRILGFTANMPKIDENFSSKDRRWLARQVVTQALDELGAILILEGFDEIPSSYARKSVISEIVFFAENLKVSRFIVTARTGEFNYTFPRASFYELCPLDKAQLAQFSEKWLNDKDKAIKFLSEIKQSPFADTAIRPLTIAHLCAIYERVGKIPDKPKTVYRKVVNLLLEEWDEQRSVERISRYANFEIDRKFEFLASLAFELTISVDGTVFSTDDLKKAYRSIAVNFDLSSRDAKKVVNELESHHGLFVQAGYELFEFAHKSIQEFLAAEYLVRLPSIPKTDIVGRLPNELAIATSISSNPSHYLCDLVFEVFSRHSLGRHFFEVYITRLLQERPDFTKHENSILALVVIYSLYVEENLVNETGQLSLFNYDDLVTQFEQFIDLLGRRNCKNLILQYYEKSGTRTLTDGQKILCLHRQRNKRGIRLPKNVFARMSFLPD